LIHRPGSVAISGVSRCAIVGDSWMIRRGMKSNIADCNSGSERDGERLNRAIEVLVIERVLIVPHAATQVGYFVTHEPNPVASRRRPWSRFDLIYRRTSPSFNGRLLSHRVANEIKGERLVDSKHAALTVR